MPSAEYKKVSIEPKGTGQTPVNEQEKVALIRFVSNDTKTIRIFSGIESAKTEGEEKSGDMLEKINFLIRIKIYRTLLNTNYPVSQSDLAHDLAKEFPDEYADPAKTRALVEANTNQLVQERLISTSSPQNAKELSFSLSEEQKKSLQRIVNFFDSEQAQKTTDNTTDQISTLIKHNSVMPNALVTGTFVKRDEAVIEKPEQTNTFDSESISSRNDPGKRNRMRGETSNPQVLERQAKVAEFRKQDNTMTNAEIAARLNTSPSIIHQDIIQLIKLGILESNRGRKGYRDPKVIERRRKIVELRRQDKSMTNAEMAAKLNTNIGSIQQDIVQLIKQGKLKSNRGRKGYRDPKVTERRRKVAELWNQKDQLTAPEIAKLLNTSTDVIETDITKNRLGADFPYRRPHFATKANWKRIETLINEIKVSDKIANDDHSESVKASIGIFKDRIGREYVKSATGKRQFIRLQGENEGTFEQSKENVNNDLLSILLNIYTQEKSISVGTLPDKEKQESKIRLLKSLKNNSHVRNTLKTPEDQSLFDAVIEKSESINQVIIHYSLGLIIKIANEMETKEAKFPSAEKLQEGYIALQTAIENFDNNAGIQFSTFAEDRIQDALVKARRNNSNRIFDPHLVSIYEPIKVGLRSRDASTVKDLLKDTAEDAINAVSRQKMVEQALESLTGVEKEIFILRYFEDQSRAKVAETLGISVKDVTQIERRAISRLQNSKPDQHPDEESNPDSEQIEYLLREIEISQYVQEISPSIITDEQQRQIEALTFLKLGELLTKSYTDPEMRDVHRTLLKVVDQYLTVTELDLIHGLGINDLGIKKSNRILNQERGISQKALNKMKREIVIKLVNKRNFKELIYKILQST